MTLRLTCECCGKTGEYEAGQIHTREIRYQITRGKRKGEWEEELPIFSVYIAYKRHYLHADCRTNWWRTHAADYQATHAAAKAKPEFQQ